MDYLQIMPLFFQEKDGLSMQCLQLGTTHESSVIGIHYIFIGPTYCFQGLIHHQTDAILLRYQELGVISLLPMMKFKPISPYMAVWEK